MEKTPSSEWSFLKAPYEELSSKYKSNKRTIEKELSFTLSHLKTMKNHSDRLDRNQTLATLSGLKSRLSSFQMSLPSLFHSEDHWLSIYESRIQYISSPNFSTNQLYMFLIDYFTRENKFEIAQSIATDLSLQAYSDIFFFEQAEKISQDLKQSVLSSALDWCDQHKSKLQKIKSNLEFQVKLQKFLEFVKGQNNCAGILYARSHLCDFPEHQQEIQKAMMLLVIGSRLEGFQEYQDLLSDSRWEYLASLFTREMKRVYGFTTESLIEIYLRAGIISIKNPLCESSVKVKGCPTCNPDFQRLSKGVPYACQSHTSLICRILGSLMDDSNPPVILPNGQIFSEMGLKKISENGKVTCPITGSIYSLNQVSKVFII